MGVREGLLALLEREPAYGYQLKTGFDRGREGEGTHRSVAGRRRPVRSQRAPARIGGA